MTLPGELAGPLPIPGPERPLVWLWITIGLLILFSAFVAWSHARLRRRATATLPHETSQPTSTTAIGEAIRALQRKHLDRTRLRDGCHQLSQLLRDHYDGHDFGARGRLPVSRMTALELRRRLRQHQVSDLFIDLARLQFGAESPGRKAFRKICRRALELVEPRAARRGAP